jgi:hypothetical protein
MATTLAVLPSVRMARAYEQRRRTRAQATEDRLASILTLNLEPVLHLELLMQMAEVLAR